MYIIHWTINILYLRKGTSASGSWWLCPWLRVESGFPFFASCVFKHLGGDRIYDLNVPLSEVPDPEVRAVLETVCVPLCECFA